MNWMKQAAVVGVLAMTAAVGSAQVKVPAPATAPPPHAESNPTNAPVSNLKPRVGTPDNPFPPVDPKNFTASTPTVADVNAFLKQLWGYDENRVWSVAAILKTPAPGVAKVVVFVADKSAPGKGNRTVFFTTPDGQHVIAESVIPFGPQPFAANKQLMLDHANGPARGAADKKLLLVEFSALQCANCAAAQEKIDQLEQDFPEARIVFEDMPQVEISPLGPRASAVGVCIRQAKGDAAFFTYLGNLYAHQGSMTPASIDATLKNAETAAGADPAAVEACSTSEKTRGEVQRSLDLAAEAGIEATPTLSVNGRILPLSNVPYELLKKIVVYQAGLDGVTVHVQPTLKTLK